MNIPDCEMMEVEGRHDEVTVHNNLVVEFEIGCVVVGVDTVDMVGIEEP